MLRERVNLLCSNAALTCRSIEQAHRRVTAIAFVPHLSMTITFHQSSKFFSPLSKMQEPNFQLLISQCPDDPRLSWHVHVHSTLMMLNDMIVPWSRQLSLLCSCYPIQVVLSSTIRTKSSRRSYSCVGDLSYKLLSCCYHVSVVGLHSMELVTVAAVLIACRLLSAEGFSITDSQAHGTAVLAL